jgi:hypothetical protein
VHPPDRQLTEPVPRVPDGTGQMPAIRQASLPAGACCFPPYPQAWRAVLNVALVLFVIAEGIAAYGLLRILVLLAGWR